MSEIIEIGIRVTLLKSQNMKIILIYLKVNLFLYTYIEVQHLITQNKLRSLRYTYFHYPYKKL